MNAGWAAALPESAWTKLDVRDGMQQRPQIGFTRQLLGLHVIPALLGDLLAPLRPTLHGYYPVYVDLKRGNAGYCAWHDYTQNQYYPGVQPGISFTNMPYVLNQGTGCGQNSVNTGYFAGKLDGFTIVVGHEIEETITDPGAEDVINGVNLGGYFFKPQAGVPPYPALILLHGFPGHAHNMAGLARAASANGYAALALSLRGWLGSEGESDQGLRQPLDVLAAIDWLAKRPLVALLSGLALLLVAIALTALLAAAHKPPIKAVASFFAATDLARWREANPFVRDYLDDLCGPEGLPVRSPILRVAQIDVPVLLIHGDRDENVSVAQTLAMEQALKGHGKEVETFIVQSGTHFFTEQQNALARRKLFDFLRRHLNRS